MLHLRRAKGEVIANVINRSRRLYCLLHAGHMLRDLLLLSLPKGILTKTSRDADTSAVYSWSSFYCDAIKHTSSFIFEELIK